MYILVLGRAGDMAEVTTKDLPQFYGSDISKIILADIDLEATNGVVARVEGGSSALRYI